MRIRPVDENTLAAACRSIAQSNYGFVYVDRDHEAIKTEYESEDVSWTRQSSLSTAQIKESLREMTGSDNYAHDQIRPGVFYLDPFKHKIEANIAAVLEQLFRNQIVVTAKQLRSQFNVAHDDAGFFAEELQERDYVMRIVAGNVEYYTVGPHLKDAVDGEGEDLDDKLARRSMNGRISHDQLEDAISVQAVSDVIDYLQSEGHVINLDGEYLIPEALDEFVQWLAGKIEEEVLEEFEEAGYVMPASEYNSLVESRAGARSNSLAAVRSSRGNTRERDILQGIRDQFADGDDPQIEIDGAVAVYKSEADREVESRAEQFVRPVLNDKTAATPEDLLEEIRPDVTELTLTQTQEGDEYLQEQIINRSEERIWEDF